MLKGGIIGLGRMGLTHYSILNTHPDVEFVALCDSSDLIIKVAREYLSLNLFNDYRKMLDEIEMDFIIITTPTALHADIVKYAAQKNINMFVEKPFSLSPDEGEELIAAIKGRGIVNQVGYYMRFNEIFKAVRKIIDGGFIGKISYYKNEMYGRTVLKASKSSWRSKKETGGGCLMDFGIHCIDLSDYMFGKIKSISGSILKSIYSTDVDDLVYTMVEHEGEVSGNLIVCWSDESYRRPYNRIEIIGTNGKIIADKQEYRLYLREVDNKNTFNKGWNVCYLPDLGKEVRFDLRGSDFTNQLDHFIQCIQNNKIQTDCTFDTGLRADIVVDKIKRDFAERRS